MNFLRSIVVLALLSLLLSSCFNDQLEPVAPTWDVDLTVPLANREYTVMDLVDKEPSLVATGAGNQLVYHTRMVAPLDSVKDAISLNPTPSVRSVKVGVFGLDPVSLSVDFNFPFLPPGSTLPGLPDTVITVADVYDTVSSFTAATFESGTIEMTVQNNLRDTLVIQNDILLHDSTHQVAALTFAGTRLARGQQAVRSASLAGQTVTRIVRLSGISFHLLGKPGSVTVPAGPLVRSTISMTLLRARSAVVAHIPTQRLTDNDTTFLAVNDSTILKNILFRQGSLRLDFESRVQVDLKLIYRFPEVLRPAGVTFATYFDSLFLPRFGTGTKLIATPGYKIRSTTGDLVRSLEVISSLDLPGADNVTLHDTDKVVISFSSVGKVVADSAEAVLKPTWITVNTGVALGFGDLPKKFSGQFAIPAASLRLNTLSTIGFPMDLYLQITMKNPSTGLPVVLAIPAAQRRVFPGNSIIIFDSTTVGSFLTGASPGFPDSVHIAGSVLVNPPDTYNPTLAGVGTISGRSFIRDTVTFDVPLKLSLQNGTMRDTTSVSIDRESVDKTNNGTLYVEVANSLPLQVGVTLYLLDSTRSRVLLRIPQAGQPPIAVAGATVDAQGNVSAPVQTNTAIALSSPDVRALGRSKNIAYSLSIGTTPGSPVRIRTTDKVNLRLWSRLSFRVSK